jgi:hypothetical protein
MSWRSASPARSSDRSCTSIAVSRSRSAAQVNAELIEQPTAHPPVQLEGIGLPAGAVQRQHQLRVQSLVKGVLPGKGLEFRYQRRVSPSEAGRRQVT